MIKFIRKYSFICLIKSQVPKGLVIYIYIYASVKRTLNQHILEEPQSKEKCIPHFRYLIAWAILSQYQIGLERTTRMNETEHKIGDELWSEQPRFPNCRKYSTIWKRIIFVKTNDSRQLHVWRAYILNIKLPSHRLAVFWLDFIQLNPFRKGQRGIDIFTAQNHIHSISFHLVRSFDSLF